LSSTDTMRARIASELNRALADTFGNSGETFATVVNRAINSAIRHYESQPFRWNQVRRNEWVTTANGVANVSLPANLLSLRKLEIIYSSAYYELPLLPIERVDNINRFPSMTAYSVPIPTGYGLESNVVVLAPPVNATRTLAATYIQRFLPTSCTGSYTAVIPVSGSYTLSVTTTASHNNRINGWYSDGAELIRARARADILINYIKKQEAIAEMQGIASRREPYLCVQEAIAYESLRDKTDDLLATGRVRPYCI